MNDSPSLLDAIMPLILLGIGYWLWYLAKGSYTAPRRRNVRAGSLASLSAPNTPSAPPALQGGSRRASGSEGEPAGGGPPPLYRARQLVAYADNPCDHPYDELPLNELFEHLYDKHFEVVNMGAERDWAPMTWRKAHAEDHGLKIR